MGTQTIFAQSGFEGYALSPQQKRVWDLMQRESHYLAQVHVSVKGEIEVQRLAAAFRRVMLRHEILRSRFDRLSGVYAPVQVVMPEGGVLFEETDLRSASEALQHEEVERVAALMRDRQRNLPNGCPLQVHWLRFSDDSAILLAGLPALCADAGTLARLVNEAALLSSGIELDEPVSYTQFSAWQNELLQDSIASGGQRLWERTRQAAGTAALALPLEDSAGADGGAPHKFQYHLGTALAQSVLALAQKSQSTVEQILLSAWMALLSRLTGASSIVVGMLFDPRADSGSELDRLLGPCSRYLPVMVHLDAERSWRDFLANVGYAIADAREGADAFSWDLFEVNRAEGAPAFLPFAFEYAAPFQPLAANGARFHTVSLEACHDYFRLRLSCAHTLHDGLLLRFHYAPHRFAERAIHYLADAFETFLASAVANPERPIAGFNLVGPVQRRDLLIEFNATTKTVPFTPVHRRFEEMARRFPEQAAIVSGDTVVAFAELDARANRLASWLRSNGIGPDSRVGICLHPSPELIVSLLAVLKAGGAYVPVNPAYPVERIRFMTAGILILASAETASVLPESSRTALVENMLESGTLHELPHQHRNPDRENLAYVIYTSGSTGEPKGVLVTHAGLANYIEWTLGYYSFGQGGNGAPLHSSIAFDLTVTTIFGPLLSGEPVHIAPVGAGPEALVRLMRSAPDFTFVKLTPSHLRLLNQQLTAEQASKAARSLILGGEALQSEHAAFWASAAPEVMLFNEYGPTETVVGCCCYATPAGKVGHGAIPIGHPIRNTRLYVLDADLNPVAAGLAGELFIGGTGVARGYFDRPDLTAERFIADAFGEEPGSRLYRTGDLVRFLRNGALEYMGRIDDQIKIRGYRIEPGEIEAVLIAHGGVRAAVVIADEPQSGERRLVAYFVPSGTETVAIVELRRFLETRLPDYMVPAIYIQLTALPLTPNGKVDRLNLPAPGQSRAQFENAFVIPLTLEEEVLAGVWSQVLKVQDVGADDNYFALGGDSIRSIQIVARAQERGLHFSVDDLFKHPTIRGLAKVLHGADNGDTLAAPAFSMISQVDRERIPAGVDDAYPLTQLQAGMIFHREYRPGSAIYHDISSFYVRAPFDPAKLQIAVNAMGARHEALRTSFDMVSFSQPLQLVHRNCDFSFRLVDISDWTLPQQEAEVDRFYEQEKTQGFDFERPPLLRIWIHLRGPSAWQFTLSFHHAILDGWSEASLITEMFHHYLALVREETVEVNPPVTRFRDYIALEQAAMTSEEAADFWTGKLQDAVALELPRWRQPAPEPPTRREILVHEVPLAQEVSDGLKRLALSTAVPVKDVLLAAHLRVLALLCGNTDVLTCVVSAGRPETMDGERVAGLFINSIPFRVRLGGGSWSDLVTEVFDAERELLPYRRFPMAEIRRRLGGQPLSETLFYFTHYHVYQSVQRIPEVTLLGARLYEETSFTMASNFRLDAFTGGVAFILKCDGSVLGIEQVHAIADCYLRCLTAMALSPLARYENFPLLSDTESREILEVSHGNARDYTGPACIHEWIEQQAADQPEAEAVRGEAGVLSYAELDGLANQVAHALRSQGVGAEVRVGVCLERGLEMVVALLGVLKAGGAYVPMEPGYPAERLAWIAEDAGIKAVISQRRWAERLGNEKGRLWLDGWEEIAGQPKSRVEEKLAGENLAYVIYTSGSTGRPKGAMNTHGGIRNRLLWMQEYFGLESKDVVLQKTPFSFDVSVWEFFWPLMVGARLVMARPGGHQDSGYLVEVIEREQVSTVHFVPSMLEVFLEEEEAGGRCGSLRRVMCSGEAMSRGLQERFEQRLRCGLYNLYGPTEASVDVTVWECEGGSKETVVPIGRPIANTEVYVVDEYGEPTPVGVAGEVYLGGAGLGRGYLGRADWTAERWVPDSLSGGAGGRLYRTGDVGRRRGDGAVEYIGRGDQQVKLRGFRIELGEIEEALRGCGGVREAVVAVKTEGGDARLVGYVVGEKELALGEVRLELQRRLPEYMVPSAMMRLESLPLSANGKLDRKALPSPDAEPSFTSPYMAPRNETESILARIWAEVLKRKEVGIHENFFEMGGHSLSATLATARVRAAIKTDLPLRALYESPTVARLATWIMAQTRGDWTYESLPVITHDAANHHAEFPLAAIQQAYWIGRRQGFELGGTSAHLYLEFDAREVDVARLEQAVQVLVRRHDMLRAVIAPDGLQRILPSVPPYQISVLDLTHCGPSESQFHIEKIRGEMSHYVFDPAVWPLFDIRVEQLPAGSARLHVGLDVLILDAGSIGILTRELALLYRDPGAELVPLDISFRDYVLAEEQLKSSALYRRSRDFWLRRIETLPPSPELPLLGREAPAGAQFTRHRRAIGAASWQRLQQRAATCGLTPSSLLLAAYARVLAWWSKSSHFTLNLTTFNRLPMHPQVSSLIGDFTSLTLVPVEWTADSFQANAVALQRSLVEGLDHAYFHGIEVLRELARRRDDRLSAAMPVVLTSTLALNTDAKFDMPFPAELVSGITQTPQTYLDNQLSERDGELVLNWDVIEEMFPEGLIGKMFGAYVGLLERLANEEVAWSEAGGMRLMPAGEMELIRQANATAGPQPRGLLQDGFFEQARKQGERAAVLTAGGEISYGELAACATEYARELRQKGVKRNELVGVVMEKGWEQVAAVLAIVESGGAYLPIEARLPEERRRLLLELGEVRIVLTQERWQRELEWPAGVEVIGIKKGGGWEGRAGRASSEGREAGRREWERVEGGARPEDLAYVIFTSGSTGVPKGVMMEHGATLNTIVDMNRRFGVTEQDRILGLSSLSFDLSVYDIFGILGAGGGLVLAEAGSERDPGAWLEAGREQGVTIWNSVPALLEMAVEYAGGRGEEWPGSLRQALLSGDWIPVTLPEKAREVAPQMKLDSLGGATEAAIWSIHYPIGEVAEGARSIPYGRAMVNQRFYVLDEWGEERPVWATGQLHIGGVGLARGYWRDEERTKEQFWVHGRTGERLYKTGDLGRWLPEGNIEFLGREDAQVKIQGHRIELGEIEAALRTHAAVKEAVVTVLNSASGRRLAAYVVLDKDKSVAEPAAASNVLLDVSARESFKHQALQLRSRNAAAVTVALSSGTDAAETFFERRSHHAFRSEPLPFKNFSRFLSQLRQVSLNGKPKYQYASAGGVYPVQLYLSVKPERVEGLEGGIYYYNPVDHELHLLSSSEIPESIHWPANREAFRNSAISLFLVAEKRAIDPLYGSKARDFCLIEAGILMQLLEAEAPLCGLGNCQIGSVDAERVRELLNLGPTQEIVHSSVAGYALPVAAMPSIQLPAMKHDAHPPSVHALRRHLEGLLPVYMVPSAFMILNALPLGSNGKVERKGLPPIEESQTPQSRAQVAATDDVLKNKIAAAMSQELDGVEVDHNQNFFDLGATSLTLVRFANRLLKEHQVQAPIIDIFRYSTVTALAQRLAMAAAESPSVETERARAARGHQVRSRLARAREASAQD